MLLSIAIGTKMYLRSVAGHKVVITITRVTIRRMRTGFTTRAPALRHTGRSNICATTLPSGRAIGPHATITEEVIMSV